ncbi:CheY chemotaxis protein or a CheY-like REC (receiver) domain [Rhizobium hainanense]|uniref:CheY chemotaxis protein or a CheY-like REC (Receiver) domain n=2 Tax=Rhizobium hainanense TaxID=52131 RepID=A0A1C3UGX1_9HYPH|nr:CheY chemotaxis protein or a CheY-like REC (receiver) domain [Rhizobium hainanense]
MSRETEPRRMGLTIHSRRADDWRRRDRCGTFYGVRQLARTGKDGADMTFQRVLILEDNLIIAMEAEEILHLVGIQQVEIASNLEQAVNAIHSEHYDFAMLDVNLGESTSFGFARLLMERGISFGFVTGYSDTLDFPADLRHVPLLNKPFDEQSMRLFVESLAGGSPLAM